METHGAFVCILFEQVRATTPSGCTPLHLAARMGRIEAAKLLIASGVSVNHTDLNRANALHYAAFMGRVDVCRILLQNGVPISAPTLAGDTAMGKARAGGHEALAESMEKIAELYSEGMAEEAKLMLEALEEEDVLKRQAEIDMANSDLGTSGDGDSSGGGSDDVSWGA